MMGRIVLCALALVITTPGQAVGLGPLAKSGNIDGPRKGFQLTLYNPYPEAVKYVTYAVGMTDEVEQRRVWIFPDTIKLGAGKSRRLIVVASDLEPNEVYSFRVCAQRETPPAGVTVNARVCSALTVHRLR
jgi:hypothetical protein